MSTLKVNTIRHTTATTDAITLAADGTCTAKLSNAGINRNLLDNGAMLIAQRGTTSTTSGYNTLDRYKTNYVGANEAPTISQGTVASGTTPYNLGFRKTWKITNGNQTSQDAGDYLHMQQRLESQHMAGSGWHYTSASSYITFSFWLKSSTNQNFYGYLRSVDTNDKAYPFETGTLSADTWTKITKTIPGHADLRFDDDVGAGLYVYISPFLGTNLTDSGVTLNQWANYATGTRSPDYPTGENDWWLSDDATFETTGWQLEVGDVATDFEHRSYHTELLNCQRYFYNIKGDQYDSAGILGYALSSTELRLKVDFPVPMREMPTYVGNAWDCKFKANNTSGTLHWTNLSMINPNTVVNPSKTMMKCVTGSSLSVTAGECGDMEFHEDGGELTFSADL